MTVLYYVYSYLVLYTDAANVLQGISLCKVQLWETLTLGCMKTRAILDQAAGTK